MATVDRADLIALLDRLGAESDESVLQAARELHRRVGEAGLTWVDLLRPEPDPVGADETPGENVDDDAQIETASSDATPETAETARLIDRLLARRNLSDTLREDLTAMKSAIAEGTLDAMDSRYVRSLAKRLGI